MSEVWLTKAQGCASLILRAVTAVKDYRTLIECPEDFQMQTFFASIFAQVAEVGVFFAAAAALVAGALALR